jgi:ribosomal protein S18 acetylase RimI-like enzyme
MNGSMTDTESQGEHLTISVADACSEELLTAVKSLVPQLAATARVPGRNELERIIRSETTDLLTARRNGQIVGMLTLAVFAIPTGIRAWIEDVVVDDNSRGKGVGEVLTRAAIARARERGAQTVELTSRPSREAANRLYRKLGFVARETNVYRLAIE